MPRKSRKFPKPKDRVLIEEVVEERGFQCAGGKAEDAEWIRGFEKQEKITVKVERRAKFGGPVPGENVKRTWVRPLLRYKWYGVAAIFLWVVALSVTTDLELCDSATLPAFLPSSERGFHASSPTEFRHLLYHGKDWSLNSLLSNNLCGYWEPCGITFHKGLGWYHAGWGVHAGVIGWFLSQSGRFMGYYTPFLLVGVGLAGCAVAAAGYGYWLLGRDFSSPSEFDATAYTMCFYVKHVALSLSLLFLAQVTQRSEGLKAASYILSLPAPLLLFSFVLPQPITTLLFFFAHVIVAAALYHLSTKLEIEYQQPLTREDVAAKILSPN